MLVAKPTLQTQDHLGSPSEECQFGLAFCCSHLKILHLPEMGCYGFCSHPCQISPCEWVLYNPSLMLESAAYAGPNCAHEAPSPLDLFAPVPCSLSKGFDSLRPPSRAVAATKWKDQGHDCKKWVTGTCIIDWGVGGDGVCNWTGALACP